MSHHKKPNKPAIPKSNLFITCHSNLTDRNPSQTIKRHPFTGQINVLCHAQPNSKNSVLDLLETIHSYQHIPDFDISLLITPIVSRDYLRRGSFVAVSTPALPGDDVFAVDGFGKIYLRLIRSTYETLGLTGRPSKFGPQRQYYVVEIDMRKESMRPGQKFYDRVYDRFLNFPANVFCDWLPPSTSVIHKKKKWNVLMSFVNEEGELEDVKFPTTTSEKSIPTTIEKCNSTILHTPKKPFECPWSTPLDLESAEPSTPLFLDLYDRIGSAYFLSTSSSTPTSSSSSSGPKVFLDNIKARGFFHPLKLVEFFTKLMDLVPCFILTAHTISYAPLSFINTHRPNLRMAIERQIKKRKKGKGFMYGPERGIEAGHTSWSLICFPINKERVLSKNSILKETEEEEKEEPKNSIYGDKACSDEQQRFRSWVLFKEVGHGDTHC